LLFLHIEAPDEAGHQGSQVEKIKAIEQVDEKIVGPLLKGLPSLGAFKILITSDHATPVSLKTHSPDPVPFALASGEQLRGSERRLKFGETEAGRTGLVIPEGFSVVRRMLGGAA
jgi:2,3-bisphosphoglycerate-independent phosphoglycerate mutase